MDIKLNCDICGKEIEFSVDDPTELEDGYFVICDECSKEERILSEGKDNFLEC